KAAAQIAGMLRRHGRRLIIPDAELRRMLAFQEFRSRQSTRLDFGAWQKAARPLGELDSLQKILKLTTLAAIPRAAVAPPSPGAARGSSGPTRSAPDVPVPAPAAGASGGPIVLGSTLGVTAVAVTIEQNEFAQHAAFLGGSGSGKTTAALNLIEQ